VSTRVKEDEPSTERVWAAGLRQVMARSRFADVLKLKIRLFLYFYFFSARGKPLILNQWMWGHTCTYLPELHDVTTRHTLPTNKPSHEPGLHSRWLIH
jgi:hypothetical protein